MSCKKYDNVCVFVTNRLCAHKRFVLLCCICVGNRENTKITCCGCMNSLPLQPLYYHLYMLRSSSERTMYLWEGNTLCCKKIKLNPQLMILKRIKLFLNQIGVCTGIQLRIYLSHFRLPARWASDSLATASDVSSSIIHVDMWLCKLNVVIIDSTLSLITTHYWPIHSG